MPSSLLGLALFVAMLTPGFAFLVARERRVPAIDRSALRETAFVGLASVAFNTISLLLFGTFRAVAPESTPDIGELVRDTGAYMRQNYLAVVIWAGGILGVATVIALLVGAPPRKGRLRRTLDRTRLRGPLARLDVEPIEQVSGWTKLFRQRPECFVSVSCELTDDTVVEGLLASASTSVDEDDDRSLVLGMPARMRRAGGDWVELAASNIVIAAGQIRLLVVGYWDTEDEWQQSWAPQLDLRSAQAST